MAFKNYKSRTNRYINSNTYRPRRAGKVYGMETKLNFGKWAGQLVKDVLEKDRDYLIWLVKSALYVSFTEEVVMAVGNPGKQGSS